MDKINPPVPVTPEEWDAIRTRFNDSCDRLITAVKLLRARNRKYVIEGKDDE